MEKFGLLALQGGGSGGGLPPVTSSDNGKVLAVENGAWAAADNDFVVTFTKSGSTWSADKLITDIDAAIAAKKRVYGKVAASLVSSNSTFSTETFLLPLFAKPATISYGYQFGGAYQTGTTTLFVNIVVALVPPLTQTVTAYIREIELAPAPLVVDYTVSGLPIGNVYPMSTATSYATIVAALTAGREVVAVLTSGTQELRMRLASFDDVSSSGYVAFSAVTGSLADTTIPAWYQIEHSVDESVQGRIVPLITGTMTYNSSTNTLAFTQ